MISSTNQTRKVSMTHESNKRSSSPLDGMFSMNSFMTLLKNDRHNRVELHLRGQFTAPENNTQELAELYQLSELYPNLAIFINSVGGQVDTMMEIYNCAKKFDFVVTVVNGDASSAGAMIWSVGDVRVVSEHSELMYHREGYGYIGKTDQHFDRVEFSKRRFERIFADFCGDILTEEEQMKARTTEVFFTGEEMIERGVAISWDQFHERDLTPLETMNVVSVNGQYLLSITPSLAIPIDISVLSDDPVNLAKEIYTHEEKAISNEEELKEVGEFLDGMEGKLKSIKSFADFLSDNPDNTAAADELRDKLRDVYGKGNFQVRRSGLVLVKVDGEWVDVVELLSDIS